MTNAIVSIPQQVMSYYYVKVISASTGDVSIPQQVMSYEFGGLDLKFP